jgi:hypothetical protein
MQPIEGMRRPLASLLATITVVAAAPSLASADDGAPLAGPTGAAAVGALAGTLAGVSLLVVAHERDQPELAWVGAGLLALGPASGHFQAGETGHGVVTTSIRAASMAVFVTTYDGSLCLFDCPDRRGARRATDLLALGALYVCAAATIYDVLDARRLDGDASSRLAAPSPPATVLSVGGRF